MKVFSPDSKFMIAMSRLADLIILNFVFLLTCVPVFTIGAAVTALYDVSFRNVADWQNGMLKLYFRAFCENFKQATVLFLILLGVGVCVVFDALLFYHLDGPLHVLYLPAAVFLVIWVLAAGYVFPLLSQFGNSNWLTVKNALVLSLGYLPRSMVMGVLNVFPFAVLVFNVLMFFETAFFWVFLYFSAIAYLNALLLNHVFKPYRKEEAL